MDLRMNDLNLLTWTGTIASEIEVVEHEFSVPGCFFDVLNVEVSPRKNGDLTRELTARWAWFGKKNVAFAQQRLALGTKVYIRGKLADLRGNGLKEATVESLDLIG